MTTPLTPREVHLMRSSFEQLIVDINTTITVFYKNLFEIDPSLRAMFGDDVTAQGSKLMKMIVSILTSYDRLDEARAEMEDLGRLHVDYAVTEAQYEPIGEALLRTFEQELGDKFTDEVRDIWERVYKTIADMSIDGMTDLKNEQED